MVTESQLQKRSGRVATGTARTQSQLPKIIHSKQPRFADVANVNPTKYNAGSQLGGASLLIKAYPSARNSYLASKGFPVPKATKTGTTIVGVIYKDGVILGADTRATSGSIVADKNCSKIHYIAPNMYCCGAGTAADTEMTCNMISSQLELHRLSTDRKLPVIAAVQLLKQYLFRYHGYIGAALILGGVDLHGPSLHTIYPHGSTDSLPFVTMGSGSLAAIAVFEEGWREDLSLEDGKKLVRNAICGGIFNDLGSGSNVDICVITKDGVDYIRPYEEASVKGQRQGTYRYRPGTTAVLHSQITPVEIEVVKTTVTRHDDEMETDS